CLNMKLLEKLGMQGFRRCTGSVNLAVRDVSVKVIGQGVFRGCWFRMGKHGKLAIQHDVPYIVIEGDMDMVFIGRDCLRREGLDSTLLMTKVMRGQRSRHTYIRLHGKMCSARRT